VSENGAIKYADDLEILMIRDNLQIDLLNGI
jgi:hypothetical protein